VTSRIACVEIFYIWKNIRLDGVDLHCHSGAPTLNDAQSLAGWWPLDRRYIRIDTEPDRMGLPALIDQVKLAGAISLICLKGK
jgi:hypothetical protein